MNRTFLVFLLLSITFSTMGQHFLVLEKIGTKKRQVFYPQDKIGVKIKDDDFYTRIEIVGFKDSTIITPKQEIRIEDIREVYTGRGFGTLSGVGIKMMVGGIMLLTFDIVNQSIVQGSKYEYASNVGIVSASLVAAGGILTLISTKNRYKLKGRWRLRTVLLY